MAEKKRTTTLLVGDIGGTKADLAIISREKGPWEPLVEKTLPSARYPAMDVLLKDFLKTAPVPVERASIGIPGPVIDGRAKITNLPWSIDERELAECLGFKAVKLLNDLEAAACAVPFLPDEDTRTLHRVEAQPRGCIAVIAPGTGLGEAFLVWDGARYRACASEGGHADFAPGNRLEMELLGYLQGYYDHVSYERLCSGAGIPNIYAFLLHNGYGEEPSWLTEKLAGADDLTPVIIDAALSRESPCRICELALEMFTSILGAEAGNLALKVMATGGVYLAGGIPPRILSLLAKGLFMERFLRKGRMSELLSRMPVHIVLNPRIAFLGAAYHGLHFFDD